MAKIKYDVSDVEAGGGGESPPPALYKGRIVSVKNRKTNARGEPCNDLEVVVDVGEQYSRLWTYIQLDNPATRWKLREFTDAVGLPPKGEIDEAALNRKKPAVSVKVVADTDLDGNYRGKIKNLFRPGEAPDDEGAADAVADGGGGDEGPYGREELDEWDLNDLKEYAEELGVEVPTGRGIKAKLVDALVEAEEAGEPEGATGIAPDGIDPELAADLSSDPDHYADWSDEDIKGYIDDLRIAGNLSGRKTRARMIAHITNYAEQIGGEGGDGDGTEAGVEDDYDSWPEKDLQDEINTRAEQGAVIKITGRKTKAKMIEALRADDQNEPF